MLNGVHGIKRKVDIQISILIHNHYIGLQQEDAKKQYIDLVDQLFNNSFK